MTPARIDLNEERRQAILARLRRMGPLSAIQASCWYSTEAGVARTRRDLKNLEKRGLVVREGRDYLGWRWRAL